MPGLVFLSHNSRDKAIIEALAFALLSRGIRPWFDKWDLRLGRPWLSAIEQALRDAETVLVCLGSHGLGRVQDPEHQVALDQAWRDPERLVIPVMLPGFEGEIPEFLRLRTWADLRSGIAGDELARLVRELEGQAPGPRRAVGDKSPYQALDPFREEDASRFFGRRRAVDELLEALRSGRRLLTLVGASGSGKSSLMLAGLLPAVRSGELDGSYRWSIVAMQPRQRPCHELARALLRVAPGNATSADLEALRERLLAKPTTLSDEVDLRLDRDDGRWLLAVDQLEEVFTQAPVEDRKAFLANLLHATSVEGGRVVVVATLRADFLGLALDHSTDLAQTLKGSEVLIVPMNGEELREAVTRPAVQVGIELEEGLAETLVSEVAGQPGDLPLLEFTLDALWRERRAQRLTWETYRRLGGVRGAIANRAELLYASLENDAEKAAIARIFGRLVHFQGDGPNTRRRARPEELMAAAPGLADRLVDRLVQERLLTAGEEGVEVAHEALIERWPRLQDWVREYQEAWRLQEEISREAGQWQAAGQAEDWLWRGGRLARTLELRKSDQLRLALLENDFVEVAQAKEQREAEEKLAKARWEAEEREREALRRLRRSRVLAGVFVTLAVLAIAAAGLAFLAQQKALDVQEKVQKALVRSHSQEALRLSTEGRQRRALTHLGRAAQLARESSAIKNEAIALLLRVGYPIPNDSLRHEEGVYSASFSPDGERVVTASDDDTARVWEASTGKPVGEQLRHKGAAFSAAFSPDGQRVVTASEDNAARVWDVPTFSTAEAETLAELAEVVGGYHVTELGSLEPISPEERSNRLAALRQIGSQAKPNEPTVASFIRWYFTPRFERTISPLSKMTVEEYITEMLALGTEAARREAEEVFPGHPLLRQKSVSQPAAPNP